MFYWIIFVFLRFLFITGADDELKTDVKCSSGLTPFYLKNGTVLTCSEDENLCEPPYECDRRTRFCCPTPPRLDPSRRSSSSGYFESDEDHERLCGKEGRLLKEKENALVKCHDDQDCLQPSICSKQTGFCCLQPLHQETPFNGCPLGYRPLKNTNGEGLQCSSNEDICPSKAFCHNDGTARRCCIKDSGEGCPSGSRVVKSPHGETRFCKPSPFANDCPRTAKCQWSFANDRYQCCEPFKELCPIGEVPYLSLNNGDPIQCGSPNDCPPNYYCLASSGVCCGLAGTCPTFLETSLEDDIGFQSCPDEAECKPSMFTTSGHLTGQYLCCKRNIFSCPISGTPIPTSSDPQQCSLEKPYTCPIGSSCQPSNIPGTNICCSSMPTPDERNIRYSYGKSLCPSGWKAPRGVTEYCSPTRNTCSGYASCLLSPNTQQFLCCIPNQSVKSNAIRPSLIKQYSCYPPFNNVEMVNGVQRQCHHNPEAECSKGYWCQMSREDIGIKICCGPLKNYDNPTRYFQSTLPFQCSIAGQTAVPNPTSPTQNLLCPTGSCPTTGQVCQPASGNPSVFICCTSGTGTIPLCPTGSSAQPSSTGFVSCVLGQINQCLTGYVCTQSVNLPNSALCCTNGGTNTGNALICPNSQTLQSNNGQPVYCTPNTANSCSSGYTCSESVASPGVYICCTTPSFPICPTGFSNVLDTNGQTIFCTINNPNVCPANSNCLQSSNQPQSYVCCRNTEAPRVCPNNQFASLLSNGQLETCTGTTATCSLPSYTCQFSTVLAQYVCCGAQPSMATCADGRSTYFQVAGQTYSCPQNACPTGYDCAASNVNGVNVCCQTLPTLTSTTFRPPNDGLDCPVGWNAYQDTSGVQRFCQSATDMSCPQGYSCAQSALAGIFLCCRLASPITCPTEYTTLLVNNNPRLCTRSNSNTCPDGYTCQQSNINQVYVCCGSPPGSLSCLDGQLPAYIGSNVRYCSRVGYRDVCPPSYLCSQSSRNGLNVCCSNRKNRVRIQMPYIERDTSPKLFEQADVCGSNALTYIDEEGHPILCSSDTSTCPNEFECRPSLVDTNTYCCKEAKCPGTSVFPETPQNCQHDGQCPKGLKCIRSANVPELKICCHSFGLSLHEAEDGVRFARCKGRKTFLVDSDALSCADKTGCADGFECSSFTTNGASICCEDLSIQPPNYVCQDNREPYRAPKNDGPLTCSGNDCPDGYMCKNVPSLESPICCSPIAFCTQNRRPLIDIETRNAKRCFSTDASSECGVGYSCQESTVKDLHVCCESSNHLMLNNKQDEPIINLENNWAVMEGR